MNTKDDGGGGPLLSASVDSRESRGRVVTFSRSSVLAHRGTAGLFTPLKTPSVSCSAQVGPNKQFRQTHSGVEEGVLCAPTEV